MSYSQLQDMFAKGFYFKFKAETNDYKNNIAASSAFTALPGLAEGLNTNSGVFSQYFWAANTRSESNRVTDVKTDRATTKKLTEGSGVVRNQFRAEFFEYANLAATYTEQNMMQGIRNEFEANRDYHIQESGLAICKAIVAQGEADQAGSFVKNIAGPMTSSAIINAQILAGDNLGNFSTLVVDPATWAQLVESLPSGIDPRGDMGVARFMNMVVIVNDQLEIVDNGDGTTTHTSYLLGNGALGYSSKILGAGTNGDEEGGNGGGIQQVYERFALNVHMNGTSWVGAKTGLNETPSFAELADPANWAIKASRKHIPLAAIKTTF